MSVPSLFRFLLILSALAHTPAWAALDKGDTVLITGANRGIGLELARQLSERGALVIGTARKPAEASELKALGVRVEQLDVTDGESVAALAKRLDGLAIDTLINNAGVGGLQAANLAAVDFDDMAFTFSVNSFGPLRVTSALLDNLQAGEGKQVVNISSIMGSIELNQGGYYAYRAIRPVPYPIPSDWTAGEMINYMGHHTMRPGHIHVVINKEGYRPLISQLYDGSSDYLDNDSVFAVKENLIGEFLTSLGD